jgi:hypothetical protein
MAHNIQHQVHDALVGLLKADGITGAAAEAKATRCLNGAVARATPVLTPGANPISTVQEWRKVCADLRTWVRTQP